MHVDGNVAINGAANGRLNVQRITAKAINRIGAERVTLADVAGHTSKNA